MSHAYAEPTQEREREVTAPSPAAQQNEVVSSRPQSPAPLRSTPLRAAYWTGFGVCLAERPTKKPETRLGKKPPGRPMPPRRNSSGKTIPMVRWISALLPRSRTITLRSKTMFRTTHRRGRHRLRFSRRIASFPARRWTMRVWNIFIASSVCASPRWTRIPPAIPESG